MNNGNVKNIVIFASGGGSNAEKIIEHSLTGNVKYKVRAIFTNNPKAGVITIARKYHVPHFIIDNEFNIVELLKFFKIEVVVLAGFLRKVPDKIIQNWYTINIHPSLLPKYGGRGMYGIRVHEAVIRSDDDKSGMTVHHVTSNYDEGKFLYQAELSINTGDTATSLQRRVLSLEHKFYPLVIDEACRTLDDLKILSVN
ncbi:MAG: PRGA-formyltransferase [uncultured marine phage]|uniref:phosphoribosylglycinamide formyltransferase 1 n=1 Tax=uncultured marine phage TaxID=707152 RepID=A0A8D9CBQ2_9VIRU|nr:MAG: PRGA-formyltransferase [uncultured marine phage]